MKQAVVEQGGAGCSEAGSGSRGMLLGWMMVMLQAQVMATWLNPNHH
jgi:hypothetical protein